MVPKRQRATMNMDVSKKANNITSIHESFDQFETIHFFVEPKFNFVVIILYRHNIVCILQSGEKR